MNRFAILMYHMVSEPKTEAEKRYACPPKRFEQHLNMLLREGFNVITIDAVADFYTKNMPLPDKAVLITLDDGFEDNYIHAFPLLRAYKLPAIIYLVTGLVSATNEWMSAPKFAKRALLSWSQIKEMSDYDIYFGSHTVSHPRLNTLDCDNICQQLSQSKQIIEDNLGKACLHFAYPYGLVGENTQDWVQKIGFKTACTTQSGFNNATTDPLMLHRIEVYGSDSAWQLKQKLTFGMNDANLWLPMQYYYQRLVNKLGLNRYGY